MKTRNYLIFFLSSIYGCFNQKNKLISNNGKSFEYKMISYESKAYVDSSEFPTIKIWDDNFYEIHQNNKLINDGNFIKKADTLNFKISNTIYINHMDGYFLDSSKKILRIFDLNRIGVEANYGDFEKIK